MSCRVSHPMYLPLGVAACQKHSSKARTILFNKPNPIRSIASCFHLYASSHSDTYENNGEDKFITSQRTPRKRWVKSHFFALQNSKRKGHQDQVRLQKCASSKVNPAFESIDAINRSSSPEENVMNWVDDKSC